MLLESLIGTGVAVVTPFTEDDEVDYPTLRHIINYLIKGKVEYLVALGTTGEPATLSEAEKEKVLAIFAEECHDRIPFVIGVGGNNTSQVSQKIAHYTQSYHPLAILSVSPYYNKPSQEGIFQHYRTIASNTDLPIILYNVPGRTASNITATTTLRLANEVPNIVAMKEASGNFDQCMRIAKEKPKDFLLLSGEDALTLPLVSLGAQGVISVTANALPMLFSELVRAALVGDFTKARQIHFQLMPFMSLNFAEGNPAGVKQLMSLLEISGKHVRLPLVPTSEKLETQMKQALELLKQQTSL